MANEVSVQAAITIASGNLNYRSNPTSFTADLTGAFGPTPGALTISTDGEDIDLSELTSPGWCIIRNIDATNFIEWGIWDGVEFIVVGRILPGQSAGPFQLSPNIGASYATGTATTDSGNTLRLKADTAAAKAIVDIFEA